MLRKMVSPPTATKTYFIKGTANRSGGSDNTVKPLDTLADDHLDDFTDLDVSHRGANNFNVTGILNRPGHPKNGQRVNVSTHAAKTSSGAHKGRVFTTKLENEKNEEQ
mgnify:FL=1